MIYGVSIVKSNDQGVKNVGQDYRRNLFAYLK